MPMTAVITSIRKMNPRGATAISQPLTAGDSRVIMDVTLPLMPLTFISLSCGTSSGITA